MIPLIIDFYSIIKISISNSILQILNSYKSLKTKKQLYFGKLFFLELLILTIYVNQIPYICLGNAIWILFIFFISISNYHYLLGYIRKVLYFGLNGIRTSRFFEFFKKLSYFSIFSLVFSKKELKTTKNISKINKQNIFTNKIITISSIIFVLLFLINIDYFENLYEPKQHLLLLKEVAKFLKNPINYPIVPLLWLNDNETICNIGLGCDNESIGQGRSYVDKNIDISHCFFTRSSSYTGSGGVIYVDGGSYSMSINYSIFYNCVCSSYGGTLYFSSSNSSLRMICANSCSASNGHFAYLQASQVNQVEYLSLSNCSHTTSGYYSIRLYTGDQRVDNTNSSMNNAIQVSGIFSQSPFSFTTSHCTFSNNKVSNGICIFFSSSSGTISMSYANIVHNNSPSIGVVYVREAGSRKMMYCIFNKNQNYLFCVYGGSLELLHSFIDHSTSSFSTLTVVSTSNNNSFTNTITYQLQFFNSLHCNADMPLPHRTPDQSHTPKSTLENTPMNTPEDTPMNTPEDTPKSTLENTPMNTPEDTPMNTPEDTPMNTPEDTPMNTPEDTLNEPQNDSSSVNSLRLVLVSLSVIVLLISGIFVLGFLINSKQESSNKSSSKSDGKVLETV